jgi:hypothetical protein
MKEIKIRLHSVIDVITNSSTEIFVGCAKDTKTKFKYLISQILLNLKCEKSFDDLFILEETFNVEKMKELKVDNKDLSPIEFSKKIETLLEYSKKYENEGKTYLHLKIKDSNLDINISKEIINIFNVEEYEN